MSTHLPGVAGQASNNPHDNPASLSASQPDHGTRARDWMVAIGAFAAMGGTIAALLTLGLGDSHKAAAPSAPTASPINITVANTNTLTASPGRPEVPASKPVSPQPSPAPIRIVSAYERYINATATRVSGTLNVAVALRGLPGHPPAPLEGAMERALLGRG